MYVCVYIYIYVCVCGLKGALEENEKIHVVPTRTLSLFGGAPGLCLCCTTCSPSLIVLRAVSSCFSSSAIRPSRCRTSEFSSSTCDKQYLQSIQRRVFCAERPHHDSCTGMCISSKSMKDIKLFKYSYETFCLRGSNWLFISGG